MNKFTQRALSEVSSPSRVSMHQMGFPVLPFGTGDLLTTFEAAHFLRISADTLKHWRSVRIRRGPRYIKVHSRRVLYRLADVEAFLKKRTIEPRKQHR